MVIRGICCGLCPGRRRVHARGSIVASLEDFFHDSAGDGGGTIGGQLVVVLPELRARSGPAEAVVLPGRRGQRRGKVAVTVADTRELDAGGLRAEVGPDARQLEPQLLV